MGYGGPWKKVRLLVLERDKWRCQIRASYCTGAATEVDHIVPTRSGGAMYDLRNLRAACRSCNSGRRNVGRNPTPSRPW